MRPPLLIPLLIVLAFLLCLEFSTAEDAKCDLNCGTNGKCVLNNRNVSTCQCDSDFAGDRCELAPCSTELQQCKNNGKCYMNSTTSAIMCLCPANHQFTGALCEKSVCADYCHHDARCQVLFDQDGKLARPSCTCADTRFSGERCEFDKCKNKQCPANCFLTSDKCECICGAECNRTYCNSNGACVDKDGQLGCKCNAGYSGDTCFVDDCKGYCFFDGKCKRAEEGVYCECPNKSTEKRCSMLITSKPDAASSDKTLPGKFQVIRVIIYGITITLLLCLFAICAYVVVQRGYADRLFAKRQTTSRAQSTSAASAGQHSTRPAAMAERARRLIPSFRFFKSSQAFNRLDDEQPITHYENANV